MSTRHLGPILVLSLAGSLAALPQEPTESRVRAGSAGEALAVSDSVFDGFGLTNLEGELIGNGPDYEAWFRDDGFTLTPVLGDRATVQRFGLQLSSVGRRDSMASSRAPSRVQPQADGFVVRYPRRGFTEVYEVRKVGVKQSFVFDRLPAGAGDLVVRMAVTTDLPLGYQAADEMRFELDGIGGVRIGEVVGIDAAGRRVAGAMAYVDGELELVLPAAFVDTAVLPLELDPLIRSIFGVGGTAQDDGFPDAAFDVTWDRYLVVWQRRMGTFNYSIMGQLVTSAGVPIPNSFTIRNNVPDLFSRPRVANINSRDTFVVAWQENEDIRTSVVVAQGGALTLSSILVASGPHEQWSPAVGGESSTSDDDAVITWFNNSAKRIMATRIRVSGRGVMTNLGNTQIHSGPFVASEPDISRGNGFWGRHLIVWGEGPTEQVTGAIVDRNLAVLDGPFAITEFSTAPQGTEFPAVDGDGVNWIVAYERNFPQGGDEDIACRGVSYDPNQGVGYLSPAQIIVEGGANDPELRPAVGWLGGSALIAYHDWNSPNWDTYVTSVDPFDCVDCEGELVVDTNSRDNRYMQIATQLSGGSTGSGALMVWGSQHTTSLDSNVRASLFRGDHGAFAGVAPGCSAGGTAHATCAIVPNSSFDLRLRGAAPNAPAILMLAASARFQTLCGTCAFGLDARTRVSVRVADTDAFGNTVLSLSIPNDPSLVGAALFEQWLVIDVRTPTCPFRMSSVLSMRFM